MINTEKLIQAHANGAFAMTQFAKLFKAAIENAKSIEKKISD